MGAAPEADRRISWLVFAVSAAGILLQCVQTRVFGVVLWSHFVYFIISIALLGYGISGTWLALGRDRWLARRFGVGAASALFIATTILSTVVLPAYGPTILGESAGRLFTTFGLYSLAVVPYFACGWILGVVFRDHAAHIHRLYFIDLVGAGLGCVVFVALIQPAGATALVAVACALVGVPALLLEPAAGRRRKLALALAALLAPLAVLARTLDRAMLPNPEKHQGMFMKAAPGDPLGLRRLGEETSEAVPWMWGINGGATVVGSIVATMIAMTWGFTAVLAIAAGGYALAGLAARAAQRPAGA